MTDTNQKLREALQALLEESIHESMATANARSALALPNADHIPDAGEMVVDHLPDAGKMIETAAPVGELPELPLPTSIPGFYDIEARKRCVYTADQMRAYARAALSAGDAVDAQRYRWLREQSDDDFVFAVVKNPHFDVYESPEELDAAIDEAMRKGQL